MIERLFCYLGIHDPVVCVETGEFKFEYQNVYDLLITRFTQYRCNCGRKFWMPAGSFFVWQSMEMIARLTTITVRELRREGRYDEAIELLKGAIYLGRFQ